MSRKADSIANASCSLLGLPALELEQALDRSLEVMKGQLFTLEKTERVELKAGCLGLENLNWELAVRPQASSSLSRHASSRRGSLQLHPALLPAVVAVHSCPVLEDLLSSLPIGVPSGGMASLFRPCCRQGAFSRAHNARPSAL